MKKIEKYYSVIGKAVLMLCVFLFVKDVTAQVDTTVLDQKLTDWTVIVKKVLWALTVIFGLIGAFQVGTAFMSEKQNANETLKKWAIGLAIIATAATIIQVFIGTTKTL